MKKIKINDQTIGYGEPTYFIADIAANHDGDLERAKDLIFLAKEAGADAAKFQHFKADTIVSDKGFREMGNKQSHQSKWKKSVAEVYQDASVPEDWNDVLAETCEQAGIHYFTSPYDLDLIGDVSEKVAAFKIGSGDINWLESVEKCAQYGKPVLIASGASDLGEVQTTMDLLLGMDGVQTLLMQCNTNYTGSLENFRFINLRVLETFAKMYPDLPLGLSDHTPGHATVLGAITLGACAIEKHFTDDCTREGPDHPFSMDPKSWREMVNRSRELELALGDGNKRVEGNEIETVVVQRRAIRAACALKTGRIISREDLTVLRPCPTDALPPTELSKVVGTTLQKDLEKGELIDWKILG